MLSLMILFFRVLSVIAGALVTMQALPPKLNPIIRPLMDAIKKEEDPAMQVC
jgi:TATA-binding protein-associated factor